jgi:3-hydroxybutyryl-CoA dehydratase
VAVVIDRVELHYSPTQQTVDAWAELSGDRNPLHVDPDYAAGTSFGSTIAHGPHTLAYMQRAMIEMLGERWLHGGKLEAVRFTAPVRPGHEYRVIAEPEAGTGQSENRWSVRVLAADGTICALGSASLA